MELTDLDGFGAELLLVVDGVRSWGAEAALEVVELVDGFFSLLVGLPEGLLEFEDLLGLESGQRDLLGQLLVQTLDCSSERVVI